VSAFTDRLDAALDRVHHWFFDPVPAFGMLICRIGLGGVLFLGYLTRWPYVEELYGPTGFAGYDFIMRYPESAHAGWPMTYPVEVLKHVSTSEPIWALYLLLLATSLAFALGVRPKIAGTIALVVHILFVARNPGAMWGWGTMIQPFMLYGICAASERNWSLGGWLRARRERARGQSVTPTDWTLPAWPQRLFQIHIACAFLVLWSRFHEQSWLDGQALPYALMNRDWSRLDFDFFPYFPLLEIASRMALFLETAAPLMLFIKPIGKYWALGLMGLFATLVITTSVGWWDFMMMTVLVLFLPPEWIARLPWPREARTMPSSDGDAEGA